ncbi:hypothetical protein N7509_005912 [Penicillium cosmopolitanum]|uniref:F-box domain-containing protein n=1 Tax=Penicillium cosmopolitanum TaxID=1131564 RepID=A0A9W9W323_9EURO|nr:uncharacterized protein N7509_005912 [Penicillium cosmopolitanum]KAJ5397799.1 hypothetical protein N7509_005912 [Penicillium cosmopolitanum]
MGTRGLEIVRFHGRYYIRWHQFDSYLEGLGANIIARIPTDPEEYQKWLDSMRAIYADRESALETNVNEIHDGIKPDSSLLSEFVDVPSEMPTLDHWVEFIYIINLDQEVLTINDSVHWKLGNIPRRDDLWRHAIVKSIHSNELTISLDMCPEEHIASPALGIPERNKETHYGFHLVIPTMDLADMGKAILTHLLTNTIVRYKRTILRFGMEWSPDSFPFRELVFALVSIASGQAKLHTFPAEECNPRNCAHPTSVLCPSKHLHEWNGWLSQELAGDNGPLLEFGFPFHRPGEPPGVSPTGTMYWFEDVLVSLSLVVDDEAIMKAVTWGIEQGRANFQIVILSLFEVAFAEVYSGTDVQTFVKASDAINLSPLRADYSLCTHPRMRPERKPGMKKWERRGKVIMWSNCTASRQRLQSHFPGAAALVNFFDVAANRRAASKSSGAFPTELYERILDFVDYDTWNNCLRVSTIFRALCLRRYRFDDRMRIVAGPFVRLQRETRYESEYFYQDESRYKEETRSKKERVASFAFENMQTGEIFPMMRALRGENKYTEEYRWMPIIGSDRKALMMDVSFQFAPAEDVPVEADSDTPMEEDGDVSVEADSQPGEAYKYEEDESESESESERDDEYPPGDEEEEEEEDSEDGSA